MYVQCMGRSVESDGVPSLSQMNAAHALTPLELKPGIPDK